MNTRRYNAFTLVELMVSIALVLVIAIGINQVFSITSQTVGASQAMSSAVRDQRAIQATFSKDFRDALPYDGPFITLESSGVYAFRNRVDAESDRDGNINTIDLNTDGDETDAGEAVSAVDYTTGRRFRTDLLNFFASGLFRRQTGNDGVYASTTTSPEALISYGHLRMLRRGGNPTVSADFFSPGDTNAANLDYRYASQWNLGRVQMLLSETPLASEVRYYRPTPWTPATTDDSLAPLSVGSNANAGAHIIQDHRYDYAQTSISQYREMVRNFILMQPANTNWWTRLSFRYQSNPYVTRPISAEGMAQAAPIFVTGCTNFIVEYAGDFFKQQPDGTIIPPSPNTGFTPSIFWAGRSSSGDGQIDFIAEEDPAGSGLYKKRIRWYGAPRDTGSSIFNPTFRGRPNGGTPELAYDVVPLAYIRDAVNQAEGESSSPVVAAANFEKGIPASLNSSSYFCAWSPFDLGRYDDDRPLMFRITLTVDDPNGRIAQGQTYEYVMKLGM